LPAGRAWSGWPFLVLLGCVLLLVVVESPLAGLVVVGDGLAALAVVASAVGLGLWIVRLLRLDDQPFSWQILLGAGLGLGFLSLLVLLLGLFGLLWRWLWIVLLVGLIAAGVVRLGQMFRAGRLGVGAGGERADWLWLAAVPMLAGALLVATVPPGVLWQDEAGGYDVLEYHLNVPKEYFQTDRIEPLPHNVYSNMPFNAEMLYLLAMVLKGDVWEAVGLAKLLSAVMAILAVAAIWLAGRQFGRRVGLIAGVMAAVCPWFSYLCGVAYVENGMVLQAGLVMAVLIRWWNERADPGVWRWSVAAGLLTGLACGYKYTAVVLLGLPVLVVAIAIAMLAKPRRPASVALFVVCGLISFGPWLAKNICMTGNPVFPLAYGLFGARGDMWNDALADRWQRGHEPLESSRSPVGRLRAINEAVLGHARYGRYLPFILAVPILLSRRRRAGDLMAAWLVVSGLVGWACLTHLVDRFAVLILPPLMLLAGRAWCAWEGRLYRALVGAVLLVSAGINIEYMVRLYYEHLPRGAVRPFGRVDAFVAGHWSNQLPEEARVLMVGEARAFYVQRPVSYAVVFSPSSLVEMVRREPGADGLLRRLAGEGYTHLFVHWSEMQRLRRTYGFWSEIDAGLFGRLEAAGLTRAEELTDSRGRHYATLYRIGKL